MDPCAIVLLIMLGFAVLLIAGVSRRGPGREAHPLLPRLVAGGALVGAGPAALGNSAGARAHEQLFFLRPGSIDGVDNIAPSWSLDLWPIGVGIVLIVVAGLIRSGERLQRDTKGLV